MFLKVNPSQTYAYVFTDSHIFKIGTVDFEIVSSTSFGDSPPSTSFQTHAVDITENYAILVGFTRINQMIKSTGLIAYLSSLNSFGEGIKAFLDDARFKDISQVFSYSRANDMSVAINPRRHIAIIGLPARNRIILLNINATDQFPQKWTLDIIRTEFGPQQYSDFGRSVVWIDDTTVAITILTTPNRPWSSSEVWVFDVDKPFKIPLFIFPNHQQKIMMPFLPPFLQTLFLSGNLYIISEQPYLFIIPLEPAGFVSTLNTLGDRSAAIFESVFCPAGTYKEVSRFGPCTVCPPQTKNNGNQSCTKCEPCAFTSFCPLGSVGDVSLDAYPSYTQTFSYPDPPDMNNYDDLLVHNAFTIGQSHHCVVVSPLFWTIIIAILCFAVWVIMSLLKVCRCPKAHVHRNKIKELLRKTDIVNEGERWVGGLLSFVIIVQFGFILWFASDFLKHYPIETSGLIYTTCGRTMHNAVFDSSLQLPLPNSDGSRWSIFNMLDRQPFIMTVDLLNTAADCASITVQQNGPAVNHLRVPMRSCVLQSDNATRSISFLWPSHHASIQLNITGPFFVGGLRICLYGHGHVDGVHTLQTLDMCQLFFTANQTLSIMTTLHMVMIKVINVTKPLKVGDDTRYHGRWAVSFAENSLSDELIYEQDGQYLRYIHERTVLALTLSEQPFYLQNNQQPMVRRTELAFHTLLFCTLIIELFGMGFLIFRLIIKPLISVVVRRCHCKK
ncbi:unnamed protein product [Adineta steineri]|uniref:Transmembrane protein n=1 Tax=Adineta steineri TaxID=433720 RepID=A0A815DNR6_9BILA|nr:unnamed protein product [Adineta steineri]CAF3843998.1 unnamed protein product [Adineta steineri]